jgi:tetratricopeptide (TPR) repeat protein
MKKAKKESKSAVKTVAISDETTPVWLLPLILFITFIVFFPSLQNELINTWDDGLYITDNNLTAALTADNLKAIFTQSVGSNYNPLPFVVWTIVRSVVGLDPFLYHLINVLLHLVCIALVFWLVRLMHKKAFVALAVTLLFAIHPMRVESVTWVTELKDVMFAAFYFAAMIGYVYWLRGGRKNVLLFLLIMVFAILSLLSKIQAVALPLSLLLIDYLEKRPLRFSLLLDKVPFFLLSAATGFLGLYFLKEGDSLTVTEDGPFIDRLFYACYSLVNYFIKLFAPINLSAYYPYPEKTGGMLPPLYYVAPVVLLIGSVLVFIRYRTNRVVVFGLLFFLFNVMFLLQIVGAGKGYMAERFTYVPYFGLFFIAAYAMQKLIEKNKSQAMVVKSVFYGYVFILAVLSFQRTKIWLNSGTLWTDCVSKYPTADVAYDNLGVYYRSIKQNDKALENYNKVLAINPNYALTYNNRGNIYFETGQDELALADYNKAIELDSSGVKRYTNRALIFLRRQEYAKAEKDFEKALQLDSNFYMIYFNRGIYYDVVNQSEKAIADLMRYLQYKPEDDGIVNTVGVSYQKLSQHQKAIAYFSKAISMNPAEPVYWQNRSVSELALGDVQNAKDDILKAKQMGFPVNPGYLQQLGL